MSHTQLCMMLRIYYALFIFSLVGYPPFNDERKDMELPRQITGGHYQFHTEYWKDISDGGMFLIKPCTLK